MNEFQKTIFGSIFCELDLESSITADRSKSVRPKNIQTLWSNYCYCRSFLFEQEPDTSLASFLNPNESSKIKKKSGDLNYFDLYCVKTFHNCFASGNFEMKNQRKTNLFQIVLKKKFINKSVWENIITKSTSLYFEVLKNENQILRRCWIRSGKCVYFKDIHDLVCNLDLTYLRNLQLDP